MRFTLIMVAATLAILALASMFAPADQNEHEYTLVSDGTRFSAHTETPLVGSGLYDKTTHVYGGRKACLDGWEIKILKYKMGAVYSRDANFQPIPCVGL